MPLMTNRQRIKLAREALAISEDCADAYVLLAEESARSLAEARDLYAADVKAGERALGEELFAEAGGHFWGITETRPYMRARAGLASCLWQLGQHQEAIGHYQEMLRLNPGDNQGLRYILLTCYLTEGMDAEAERLLGEYEDDANLHIERRGRIGIRNTAVTTVRRLIYTRKGHKLTFL